MRIKGSYIWAALIAIAIGGWVASGELVIGGQSSSDKSDAAPANAANNVVEAPPQTIPPFRVRAQTFVAEQRRADLVIRGRTQADVHMGIKAETSGLVDKLAVTKGARVKTGDLLCTIEPGARETRILEARARVTQALLDFEAANKLRDKGYTAETRVRSLKAALDAANAALFQMELDMQRTEIRAPFDGIIEEDNSEIGDLLRIGDPCVTLVALDPMLVTGQVSERDIANLKLGMSGVAHMVTGETVEGKIRYISPSAEASTRTFLVELEIPNEDLQVRNNVTAEIRIPLEATTAHKFSPAYLTLDDTGLIGVRIVGDENKAKFVPVQILGDAGDGVWVVGLPERATIITVGHDYVVDGQSIEVVVNAANENGE